MKVWATNGRTGVPPRIPEYIGKCILLICENMGKRWNFSAYSFRDEMVSDAVLNLIKAVDNFDPTKSNNPFGYFSRIAWRAFLRRIEDESHETYIKLKNMENLYVMDEFGELNGMEDTVKSAQTARNEFVDDFMKKFEERQNKQKKKRKPRK